MDMKVTLGDDITFDNKSNRLGIYICRFWHSWRSVIIPGLICINCKNRSHNCNNTDMRMVAYWHTHDLLQKNCGVNLKTVS